MADSTAVAAEAGMRIELSAAQQEARREFRAFVSEHILPFAGEWDRRSHMPGDLIDALKGAGYLGAPLPEDVGGGGMDSITYGLLTEELGYGCSSVRSLLTVHDMVTLAVRRWGKAEVKDEFVPKMAQAELLAALALSEPNVGSAAADVETTATREGDSWVIAGTKRWITYGQIADLFLVFARCTGDEAVEGKTAAFLVPATTRGFSREPIESVVGTRASMVAELTFADCRVPAEHLVGRVGFGISHVAATALDHGRYSVACGSVGIAQACLDACLSYTGSRQQGGELLKDHQLVRRKLTEMITSTRAARLLCYRAGYLRQSGDPGAVPETMIAKYFASRTATSAANDAVQLHGANGLTHDYPVERLLRDSRVMEVIEGSTQIQQISIPLYPLQEL